MGIERYSDWFETYLADILRGKASLARRRVFEEFLDGRTFTCSRCGQEFEGDPGCTGEDDEVLCSRCVRKH